MSKQDSKSDSKENSGKSSSSKSDSKSDSKHDSEPERKSLNLQISNDYFEPDGHLKKSSSKKKGVGQK